MINLKNIARRFVNRLAKLDIHKFCFNASTNGLAHQIIVTMLLVTILVIVETVKAA